MYKTDKNSLSYPTFSSVAITQTKSMRNEVEGREGLRHCFQTLGFYRQLKTKQTKKALVKLLSESSVMLG